MGDGPALPEETLNTTTSVLPYRKEIEGHLEQKRKKRMR